jgi:Kazal-type serine protease inhibitor-like protein
MRIRSLMSFVFFALVLAIALATPARAAVGGTSCMTSDECGAKALCGRPIGACTRAGACVARPTACVSTFDPVCGCDGLTYDNECQAGLAGVSVAALGPCEAMACLGNKDCPSGFMCHQAAGACGSVGVCSTMPQNCSTFMYQPVCGCDGRTYDNACMATQAGVSVDYMGICPGEKCASNPDCAYEEYYCMRPSNSCNGNGRCETRPEVCYELWAPVCGCDGKIYANSCFAAQAGVSVANAGETCRGGL